MNFLKNIVNFEVIKTPLPICFITVVIFLWSCTIQKLNAQTNTIIGKTEVTLGKELIKGSVVDEDGMPLPSVKIVNINTKVTAETDIAGNFEIIAAIDDNLEVYFHEVIIQNNKVISLNKLEILLTNSNLEQYTALDRYPNMHNKNNRAIKPLKVSLPDPDFFGSVFNAIGKLFK